MTREEEIVQYQQVEEMNQSSRGFKQFLGWVKQEIKDEQDAFLRCETDAKRFEKQIRLKTLTEVLGWADDVISRGRSREAIRGMKTTTPLGAR